jgi:hypothetical protein
MRARKARRARRAIGATVFRRATRDTSSQKL